MEIKHAEREHARFSPSSLENRELCSGWQDSGDEGSIYAADGERCHEAVEAKLHGDDTLQQALSTDLASFVQDCFDYAYPRIAGAETVVTETRLFHANPLLKENCHGTPDLYAITGNEAQLIDFKFGRRPVTNAKDNLQGWTYALALFDTYEKLEKITIHFVVPRVHKCTSCATFTRAADYDRILARVLRTAERALANRPVDYAPSWSACAYCKRKATCPVLALAVERAYELETDRITPVRFAEAVGSDKPEDLGFLQNAAKVMQDWSVQMQEQIKQKALEGHEIKGYELRFAKGRTTVNTVSAVLKAGVEIPLDKITQYATIPLVELRKIYTSDARPEEKTNKEKELMEKLAKGGALKSGEDSIYLYRTSENN
jgi:hypothetical protein